MSYDAFDLCGCSDEYGPCEEHGIVIVQRRSETGAAPENGWLQFLADAVAIDPLVLDERGRRVKRRAEACLAQHGPGCGLHAVLWDDLVDLLDEVDERLGPMYRVYREGGCCIVRVTDGPLGNSS